MESRNLKNEFADFLEQAQKTQRDSIASIKSTWSNKDLDKKDQLNELDSFTMDDLFENEINQKLSLVEICDEPDQMFQQSSELAKQYSTQTNARKNIDRQEGWLLKKSSKLNSFKEVFVVIEDRKLRYYSDDQMKNQKGIIDFDLVPFLLQVENQAPPTVFQLIITMNNQQRKIFEFKSTAALCNKWCKTITQNYAESNIAAVNALKRTSNVNQQFPGPNFWKIAWISSTELLNHSQTGDIILFSGKSLASRMIRVITGSSYDHVAMIVKYPKTGQVILFESLQGNGVCRWDWRTFLEKNWHLNYNKIVYRRLLGVERDDHFRKQVTDFMIDTVGRPYRCDVKKLLEKTDVHKEQQQIKQEQPTFQRASSTVTNSEKESFFCSELIACLFKKLGLVSEDTVPAQYYPGSFSQESTGTSKELILEDDAFFAEELSVDIRFDQKENKQ